MSDVNNVDGQSVVVYLDKYGESRTECKRADLPQFFDSLTTYEVWVLNAAHVAPYLLKNIPERFITRKPPEPEPAAEPPPRIGVEIVEGVMFGEPVAREAELLGVLRERKLDLVEDTTYTAIATMRSGSTGR